MTQKPELAQAQIAAYAAEHLTIHEADRLYKELAHSGLRLLCDYNPYTDLNIEDILDEFSDYNNDFPENQNNIENREALIENYNAFNQTIRSQLSSLLGLPVAEAKNHPRYLGSGTISDVFKITHDNKAYAVRYTKTHSNSKDSDANIGCSPDPIAVDCYVIPCLRGKGIPHLEQLVAASYEDGVTVSELLPGVSSDQLTDKDVDAISDSQLENLAHTLIAADKAGVVPELENPGNLLYDPIEGFALLDYDSIDKPYFKDYYVHRFDIDWLAELIASRLISSPNVHESEIAKLLPARIKRIFNQVLSSEKP